ncbi:MAG: hypothetical protein KAU14_04445, partial [Thermoplasmata archaeon]|nr:hypothetical protein [Thermoplasmata archaeon]
VSLFDDLGAIVSSIGYVNDTEGDTTISYVARHLDGVGPDYAYNLTMLKPWANGVEGAQPNADWDILPDKTPGYTNYDGITILQIGAVDKHYGLVENLSNYNSDWAGGALGTKKIDTYYLKNWDIVCVISGLSTTSSALLDDYILSGGRLYVEYANWPALEATDFYDHIGVSSVAYAGPVDILTGTYPLTEDMQMDYTGSVSSKFIPNEDTFRVWEEAGSTYAVLIVDIDVAHPENSYRVVASAVEYKKMSKMPNPGDEPYNYTGKIVDYFLLSDDNINHAPVINLIEPIPNELGELPLYKTRPTLIWQNKDPDVWDQVSGTMKYTLYIDTNQALVNSRDPDARSAVFVQEPDKSTPVDVLDAPSAAIYYWGIHATDKYEKTTYVSGGAFIFDDEVPSVGDIVPRNDELNVDDDPLPIGDVVVFGPGHKNSKGQIVGRPDMFAISVSDNFGLKFSNNHIEAHRLFLDEYNLPSTVFSFKVLYYYAGQYGDDLPTFNLSVDKEGTDQDLEQLTGETDATVYMIPDGPMPDGQYHLYVIIADEVRWGSYMDYFFEIDLTAPETPVDITIAPETYRDSLENLFLKAGETYTLSVTAPSSLDDASMSRVVFQQAVAGYEGATWEDIGTDFEVSDNTYSVLWTPDTAHFYLRAVAWDYVDNYAISEQFTDFRVDGAGPEHPTSLKATLNLEHAPKAEVSGFVYDRIVEGQTSGVDYVVLYLLDCTSDDLWQPVTDNGEVVHVPVIDLQFDYDIPLNAITGKTGDLSYAIFARAFDHVGNPGDLSEPAVWTNTDLPEAMRIISPASIRDIPMKDEIGDPDDSLDEIRSITVTFLTTEQDYRNFQFIIRPGELRTSSDAAALGLPKGTKFLYGYYTVEVPPLMANFEAQVTIEFHLSPKSQLGPSIDAILEDIRFIAKHSGEGTWEVLELVGDRPQIIDPANNIWRVTARVKGFSEFAVIVAQTDLTVKDIILGANPALPGQNMTITVTVHNGGDFPKDAEKVWVILSAIDEDGNEEYIGELDYDTIEPDVDLYPDDPLLMKGDKQAYLHWEAKNVVAASGERKVYTIKAEVDPEGYVRESNELNNQKTTPPHGPGCLEFVGTPKSSPSFGLTYIMMALGVMLVAGLSVYVRRKRG